MPPLQSPLPILGGHAMLKRLDQQTDGFHDLLENRENRGNQLIKQAPRGATRNDSSTRTARVTLCTFCTIVPASKSGEEQRDTVQPCIQVAVQISHCTLNNCLPISARPHQLNSQYPLLEGKICHVELTPLSCGTLVKAANNVLHSARAHGYSERVSNSEGSKYRRLRRGVGGGIDPIALAGDAECPAMHKIWVFWRGALRLNMIRSAQRAAYSIALQPTLGHLGAQQGPGFGCSHLVQATPQCRLHTPANVLHDGLLGSLNDHNSGSTGPRQACVQKHREAGGGGGSGKGARGQWAGAEQAPEHLCFGRPAKTPTQLSGGTDLLFPRNMQAKTNACETSKMPCSGSLFRNST